MIYISGVFWRSEVEGVYEVILPTASVSREKYLLSFLQPVRSKEY